MTARMARTTPIITGVSHAEETLAVDAETSEVWADSVVEVVSVGFMVLRLIAVVFVGTAVELMMVLRLVVVMLAPPTAKLVMFVAVALATVRSVEVMAGMLGVMSVITGLLRLG
jgi:hypothetical protein